MTNQVQFRFLRRPQVLARLAIGRTTLYDLTNAGLFPKPIQIGLKSVAWPEHEVDAVLAAMVAGKPQDHIRALVDHLVDQRSSAA